MDPCPAATAAVWIDADYDRENASDKVSRFGAHIRERLDSFAECWDGTYDRALQVHFAENAWQVAIGPIMTPGYVRYHPRILSIGLAHTYRAGLLLARVDLITPWPAALRSSRRWIDDAGRGWWRGWVQEFGHTYREPSEEDLSRDPYLLSIASLRFTVPIAGLPTPPTAKHGQPDAAVVVAAAQRAVAVIADAVNRMVWPVIQQLERS